MADKPKVKVKVKAKADEPEQDEDSIPDLRKRFRKAKTNSARTILLHNLEEDEIQSLVLAQSKNADPLLPSVEQAGTVLKSLRKGEVVYGRN